jgi:hypothetical protein
MRTAWHRNGNILKERKQLLLANVWLSVGIHELLNTKWLPYFSITRELSIQKSSEFVKIEHARYTLERYLKRRIENHELLRIKSNSKV